MVVHACLFLTEEKVKLKFDNNIDHLLKYLSDPNPSVEVIFICSTSKISNRLKITKKCKSFEHVYEIAPLSASQLNSAIKERISNAVGKIDQSGIEALVQYVPNNLDVIFNEVDKLLNLQTPIDRKMLRPMLSSI